MTLGAIARRRRREAELIATYAVGDMVCWSHYDGTRSITGRVIAIAGARLRLEVRHGGARTQHLVSPLNVERVAPGGAA